MKYLRTLTILTVGICLTSVVSLETTQPVQAISKKAAVNKPGYRKVRILKKTYVRKIHWKNPTYKSTLGPKRYVSKNDVVRIMRTGTDFGWYMKVPGYGGEFTILKHMNDYSWLTLNTKKPKSKKYKEGWSGNTYQSSNGTTLKVKNLKRISVFNYDNETSKPNETDLVLTVTLKNNGNKKITPSHWLESNLNIYPLNKSDDNMLFDVTDDQLITEDDNYSDKFDERKDKLPKNYYTTFCVILDGDKDDAKASTYTISDLDDHKFNVPVQI